MTGGLLSDGNPPTNLRRLPRSNAPMPGESLAGYILNLAHRLDISPSLLMTTTGLSRERNPRLLPLGFSWRLPTEVLPSFTAATGLAPEEALGLTLDSIADLTVIPRMSQARTDTQWIDNSFTRYCPECLAHGTDQAEPHHPVWCLAWVTPWALACRVHNRLLLSTCPTCDTRVGHTNRKVPSLIPRPFDPVTHAAACRAALGRGEEARACGTRLDQAQAPHAPTRVLHLQETLDGILQRRPADPTSLGDAVTGRQFLLDLRLVTIALQIANDPAYINTGDRDLDNAAMQYLAAFSAAPARDRSKRIITLPPRDTTASAGLIVSAAHLLGDPNNSDALHEISARAQDNALNAWGRARATGQPSNRLWAALINERLYTTDPERLHAPMAGRTFTFKPQNVPAFLPDDMHARHFPDLVGGFNKRVRRHVPIALVRLVGDFDSARDAGRYLGLAPSTMHEATGRITRALPGGLLELRTRIALIADELELAPRVDYHRARAAIDHDWLLPEAEWGTLRSHILGIPNAKTGGDWDWDRRRYLYSAWVWTLLTGGDLSDAPHVRHYRNHNTTGENPTLSATRDLMRRSTPARHQEIADIAQRLRATF